MSAETPLEARGAVVPRSRASGAAADDVPSSGPIGAGVSQPEVPFQMPPGSDAPPDVRLRHRLEVQKRWRFIARLARMTPREVVHRLALRARGNPGTRLAPSWEAWRAKLGASPRPALARAFDQAFFFGPADRARHRDRVAAHCADARNAVVRGADAIVAGRLELFGRPLRLDRRTVDWQADPQSGERCWPATRIDESAAISHPTADVKYVWELNRHQYLTQLGRAFWYTDDPRYALCIRELLEPWIDQNPAYTGVNWSSHLEVAMRAISWLWTLPYLLAWPDLDAIFLERWLRALSEHYDYLSSNLSIYTDPTNHLVGEACALWMLSTTLPDLPDAPARAAQALAILTREAERQVAPDGVHREQATSYQRFVLDFYLQIACLGAKRGSPPPDAIDQRVRRMLEFVHALDGGWGTVPMIGDSDDARGVPFPELSTWSFRDSLSTGAALYGNQQWYMAAGAVAEVTVWLVGAGARGPASMPRAARARPGSRVFRDGGYCVFTGAAGEQQATLIFDVGPLGYWPHVAHGHADALSILLRVGAHFILTDQGTGAYYGGKAVRDAFRATRAHNTATVDGLDQADILGTFKWVNPMRTSLRASHTGAVFDYASAEHDGYGRLRSSIRHQRSVLCVYPGRWFIVDHFFGRGRHVFRRHLNFHPAVELRNVGARAIEAFDSRSGAALLLEFPSGADGCEPPSWDMGGALSSSYGRWERAPRLWVESRCSAPATVFTVITATGERAPSASAPIYACESLAGGATALRRQERRQDGAAGELLIANPGLAAVTLSDVTTDAGLVYLTRGPAGRIDRLFIGGSGTCQVNGQRFQSNGPGLEKCP